MHARVTTYSCKEGTVEEGISVANSLVPQIRAIPGLKEFLCVGRMDDGKCVIVAIYDSEQNAEAAKPIVEKLWGSFDHVLASGPDPEEYSVFIHQTTD